MFDKYMSPELVAEMMNNPELVKPGGQNRYLTAFFSDLANFTSLSESLEPEELVLVINEYLDLMTREIIGNGGYLDKYQGDGIMAVFGVYSDEAHHALESCRAALANQRDILTLSRRWVSEGRAEVHVRIGINSGPMIAGNVGSEAKMNYTVLGDAVNLAARLESANKQFGTLIMLGHNTYELVKSEVIVRELDLLAVKGKKLGVRVYELIGMNDDYVLSTEESDMLSAFEEGLTLYREQNFEEAILCFKRGLKSIPDDGPCKSYIERCGIFAQNPPGKDWDGVYRLTSK
jgi:adenylate cyclase